MDTSTVTQPRRAERLVTGQPTQDGAGVKLTRVLTHDLQQRLDPFLMLDNFASDDPNDYGAGFPSHPHRGFETVSYMLTGNMRHKDSAGHEGLITEAHHFDDPSTNTSFMRTVFHDNGQGIPPDIMDKIFDPFFTTKPIGKGTGLGLALAVDQAALMGATVEVGDAPTGGARFTIRLPFTLAISQALIVRVGDELYALPLPTVESIVRIPRSEVQRHLADDAPPLDRLIGALKFGGQLAAASALGYELAMALRRRQAAPALDQPRPIDLIVAVPLSPARRQQRGYDQAQAIARALGRASAITHGRALMRLRQTQAQSTLPRLERARKIDRLLPGARLAEAHLPRRDRLVFAEGIAEGEHRLDRQLVVRRANSLQHRLIVLKRLQAERRAVLAEMDHEISLEVA